MTDGDPRPPEPSDLESQPVDDDRTEVVDAARLRSASLAQREPDRFHRLGQQVGPYRLIEPLGAGGMGTVYRAQRADGIYDHEVALKVLRFGSSGEAVARFLQERQILADLGHERIARLLDGGTTPDGHPYLVMEKVDGIPIDRYCREHSLGVDECLRLFLLVCEGVAEAHRRLVVHRDLKPSNVLVTPAGEVKLLDFGIAKLIDEGAAADHTRTEHRLMTPQYASPEQFLGRPVGVSSDLYQLGLILYALLTGQLPYSLADLSPAEQQRAICEDEPSKPSTQVLSTRELPGRPAATGDSSLRRQLVGDLDNIVMKALRKEPDQRYGSVDQLAHDLENYLAGRPVSARRRTTAYVLRKFVGRHRLALGAAAAGLLCLLGIGGYSAQRVVGERDRAEAALDESRAVTDFLVEIFQASDPNERPGGEEATAAELLELGLERVEELAEQPRLQARVLELVADVYLARGEFAEALPVYERSRDLRRRAFGAEADETAQALRNLAVVQRRLGDYETAEALAREALRVHRQVLPDPHMELAESHNALGVLLSNIAYRGRLRDPEAAEEQFDEAAVHLEAAARMLEVLEPDERNAAIVLNNLGSLFNKRRDFETALTFQRRALAHHRRLGTLHPKTAITLRNIGVNENNLGNHEAALALHLESLDIGREVLGEDNLFTVVCRSYIAAIHAKLGNFEQAFAFQEEYREGIRRLYGAESRQASAATTNLGLFYRDQGDLERAETLIREGLGIKERLFPPEHRTLLIPRQALAEVLALQGKSSEASSHYHRILEVLEGDSRSTPEEFEEIRQALAELPVASPP